MHSLYSLWCQIGVLAPISAHCEPGPYISSSPEISHVIIYIATKTDANIGHTKLTFCNHQQVTYWFPLSVIGGSIKGTKPNAKCNKRMFYLKPKLLQHQPLTNKGSSG